MPVRVCVVQTKSGPDKSVQREVSSRCGVFTGAGREGGNCPAPDEPGMMLRHTLWQRMTTYSVSLNPEREGLLLVCSGSSPSPRISCWVA